MTFLQGSTYEVGVRVKDCAGRVVVADDVSTVQFVIGGVEKFYRAEGESDASWDEDNKVFRVRLSEDETFGFKGVVKVQVRAKFVGGQIKGSVPESRYLYDSITETRIEDDEEVEEEEGGEG